MGNTRKTPDDAVFAKRQAYYQKHKERILAHARAQYQATREVRLEVSAKIREAERQARLLAKSEAAGYNVRGRLSRDAAKMMVALEKADKPCKDCGGMFPPYVMDFDHVRGTKFSDISTLMSKGVREDLLRREMNKCELVCANCHRIRSYKRQFGAE